MDLRTEFARLVPDTPVSERVLDAVRQMLDHAQNAATDELAQHRKQHERDKDRRKRQLNVDQAHDECFDPTTGEPAIPTLDCYVWELKNGKATTAARSSANAVFTVVEGEGRSEIGGREIRWQKNDVFTVPHWTWASHQAGTGARLFYFTDREVLRRLNWLREETRD